MNDKENNDELLAPLPPLRAPRPHPPAPQVFVDEEESESERPLAAPVPHIHPLASVSTITRKADNESKRSRSTRPLQRLDPHFLNRERVEKIISEVELATNAENEPPIASAQLHSTQALGKMIQKIQATAAPSSIPFAHIPSKDRAIAATKAIEIRPEHPFATDNVASKASPTALERAKMRKVGKQVDPKWLEQRQNAANRPLPPLERVEERELYEESYQLTAIELFESGFFAHDQELTKRLNSFEPLHTPPMPCYNKGTTGLPGCHLDTWSM